MTPRQDGRVAGWNDARAAWCGPTWKRSDEKLPVLHVDRQEWLAGYASGIAEYNRLIEVG